MRFSSKKAKVWPFPGGPPRSSRRSAGKNTDPESHGVSEGVRTLDTWSHNPVLYRLSYTHHKRDFNLVKEPGACQRLTRHRKHLRGGAPGRTRTPDRRLRRPLLYPAELLAHYGRGERIRTSDPLCPRQVRYQAALRPDEGGYLARAAGGCNRKALGSVAVDCSAAHRLSTTRRSLAKPAIQQRQPRPRRVSERHRGRRGPSRSCHPGHGKGGGEHRTSNFR